MKGLSHFCEEREREGEGDEEDLLEQKLTAVSSPFPNSLQRLFYLYKLKTRRSNVLLFPTIPLGRSPKVPSVN